MNKLKLILTVGLTLIVLFAQVGSAAAAPQAQTPTPITGTIQSITLETDANGVTTVLVTLLDAQNVVQTVRISVDTAVTLGLVTLDPITNAPVIVDAQVGQPVTIDPTTVIPDQGTGESVNPISALLASFFGEDAAVIDGFHTDGFGFGVIAQALWMSQNLNGDATLAGDILQAKRDKDFETFFEAHPDLFDGTIPTNWGQFRKAVLNKKNNLGVIVSGHEDSPANLSTQTEHGNGNNNGNGHGQGNNKNKNKGNNK
ncbi:MAG TPA: hypothetical protein VN653_09945 [Anaerolineales bacterium]|jgi:hypothetical protein|nr:hypothetical protein [Anaerolineales bacterium]